MPNIVDANYRFIAANQEVNARIAQRQQALTLYVTLTVSLLAALVALKPGEGRGMLPIEWLVLGFPVVRENTAEDKKIQRKTFVSPRLP